MPEAKRISPATFLRNLCTVEHSVEAHAVTPEMLERENTLANRVRWMLKATMGADGEFERRRLELAELQGTPGRGLPTDEAVCDSFVQSVAKGGFMRDLLEAGQLAAVLGTNLFVHGVPCMRASGRLGPEDLGAASRA